MLLSFPYNIGAAVDFLGIGCYMWKYLVELLTIFLAMLGPRTTLKCVV